MLLICIYMKVSGSKFIILIIYVDDILPATNDLGLLHETKIFFSKNLEMKDTGEASYVSGIQIFLDISQGLLGLSQRADIHRFLKRFKMEKYSPSIVSIRKRDKLSLMQCAKNDMKRIEMEKIPYASIVRSLM